MAFQKPIWLSDVDCSSSPTIENCPRSSIIGFGSSSINVIPVISCERRVRNPEDPSMPPDDDEEISDNSGLALGLGLGLGVGGLVVGSIIFSACAIWCVKFWEKEHHCCLCRCCPRWFCECCCACWKELCCNCRTECCCVCECGLDEPPSRSARIAEITPSREENIRTQERRLRGNNVQPGAGLYLEEQETTFKSPNVFWATAEKFETRQSVKQPQAKSVPITSPTLHVPGLKSHEPCDSPKDPPGTIPTIPESHDPAPAVFEAPPPSYDDALNYPKTK